jgi:hypothetical protein
LDDFAYFHLETRQTPASQLSDEWVLKASEADDMQELAYWFQHHIGGLMLDCLDLDPQTFASRHLIDEYHQHGFAKDRQLLSLRRHNRIQGCIAIHRTDIGLNLSDLTNCVKIILSDTRHLNRQVIESALHLTFTQYDLAPDTPVLLYPALFAEQSGIPVEKNYCLWILNTRCSDRYFGFLDRMFKLMRD